MFVHWPGTRAGALPTGPATQVAATLASSAEGPESSVAWAASSPIGVTVPEASALAPPSCGKLAAAAQLASAKTERREEIDCMHLIALRRSRIEGTNILTFNPSRPFGQVAFARADL